MENDLQAKAKNCTISEKTRFVNRLQAVLQKLEFCLFLFKNPAFCFPNQAKA